MRDPIIDRIEKIYQRLGLTFNDREKVERAPFILIEKVVDRLEATERRSLRDEFAAAALRGLVASGQKSYGIKIVRKGGIDQEEQITISERAYELADAMLQARDVK